VGERKLKNHPGTAYREWPVENSSTIYLIIKRPVSGQTLSGGDKNDSRTLLQEKFEAPLSWRGRGCEGVKRVREEGVKRVTSPLIRSRRHLYSLEAPGR
jgi:hypothetical protein